MVIKADDETEYVRKIARNAIWNVLFHEKELRRAQQNLAILRAVIARGNYTGINLEEMKTRQANRLAESNDD